MGRPTRESLKLKTPIFISSNADFVNGTSVSGSFTVSATLLSIEGPGVIAYAYAKITAPTTFVGKAVVYVDDMPISENSATVASGNWNYPIVAGLGSGNTVYDSGEIPFSSKFHIMYSGATAGANSVVTGTLHTSYRLV